MKRTLAVAIFTLTFLNFVLGNEGFTNVSDFGFSPESTGVENAVAMQNAVDVGGTIIISHPGIYKMASTLYVGSNTEIVFGKGVFLKKVNEQGVFAQLILNKGALTKTYDESITIEGLHIIVNGVDNCFDLVLGLRGNVGFSYVKDLKIKGFRIYDLTGCQYAMQICQFEDVIIKGQKDGIHFGPGKRFTIRDGLDDYDYMRMLEECIKEMAEKKALVKKAKKLLDFGSDILENDTIDTKGSEVRMKYRVQMGEVLEAFNRNM